MKKRFFLLFFLPVVLLLLLPFLTGRLYSEPENVAQVGSVNYGSLQAAIEAAAADPAAEGEGIDVTLLQDTTQNISIPEGKKINLLLNGKTLTGENAADEKNTVIYVETGASLLLKNGTVAFTNTDTERNCSGIEAYGSLSLTVDNVTLSVTGSGTTNTWAIRDRMAAGQTPGTVTVKDSTLTVTGEMGCGIFSENGLCSQLLIQDTSITAAGTAVLSIAQKLVFTGSNSLSAPAAIDIDFSATETAYSLDVTGETGTVPYKGSLSAYQSVGGEGLKIKGDINALFSEEGKRASSFSGDICFSVKPVGFALDDRFRFYPNTGEDASEYPYTIGFLIQGSIGDGDAIYWCLEEDDYLCFYGDGAMPDFSYGGAPWYRYASQIQRVFIGNGITYIGKFFLAGSSGAKVLLPTANDVNALIQAWQDISATHYNALGDGGPSSADFDSAAGLFIGTVRYDSYTLKRLEQVRAFYGLMSEENRAKVTNLDALTDAEKRFAELEAADPSKTTVLICSGVKVSSWQEGSYEYVPVTHVSGGGDYGLLRDIVVSAPATVKNGETDLYTFKGWYYLNATGSVSEEPASTEPEYKLLPTGSIISLIAVYEAEEEAECRVTVLERTYNVSYSNPAGNAAEGSGGTMVYTFSPGELVIFSYDSKYVSSFAGWYDGDGNLLSRKASFSLRVTRDISVRMKLK